MTTETFASFTALRLKRAAFVAENSAVFSELATLDKELTDYEGLLKEEVRQSGQGVENDHFIVTVQHKSRRVYNTQKVWANADELSREALVDNGAVVVENKKLDELITAGILQPAILNDAISEESLTSAVTIKEKGVTDGQ